MPDDFSNAILEQSFSYICRYLHDVRLQVPCDPPRTVHVLQLANEALDRRVFAIRPAVGDDDGHERRFDETEP